MRDYVTRKPHLVICAIVCSLWIATPAAAEISVLCGTEVNSTNEISYDGETLTAIRQVPSWVSTPSVLRCDTRGVDVTFTRMVRPNYFRPHTAIAEAQAEFLVTSNGMARIIESRGYSTASIENPNGDAESFTGRSEITVQNTIKIASNEALYYRFLPVLGETLEFPDFSFISSAGESLSNGALEGIIYNTDGSGNVELKIASSASAMHGINDASPVRELGPTWNFRLFVTPVPEPSTQLMLLSGLFGMGLWGRKRFTVTR